MADFRYEAFNSSGVKQKGTLVADSAADAEKQLKKQGLLIVELQAVEQSLLSANINLSSAISLSDIEFFTSELSVLLKSGLKVDRGMDILLKNTKKPALRGMIQSVGFDIRKGIPLSEALGKYSQFDSLYLGLVKIAEETGELAETFGRLASELKHQMALRSKIKQALVYPTVILVVCVAALVFIFNFVVPNLTSLFSGADNLPAYTAALIGLSEWMQKYQLTVLIALVLLVFLTWRYKDRPTISKSLQWVKENLPLLKRANLLVEQIRFNSALYTMMGSGVKVDRAISLATETLKTNSLKSEVKMAEEQIRRGEKLSDCLAETRLYPPYFASLLSIGEESGDLQSVFDEIAERSRLSFNAWVTQFTNLLEPLLIMVMGAIVGSVVVIMMLSITAVTDIQF